MTRITKEDSKLIEKYGTHARWLIKLRKRRDILRAEGRIAEALLICDEIELAKLNLASVCLKRIKPRC